MGLNRHYPPVLGIRALRTKPLQPNLCRTNLKTRRQILHRPRSAAGKTTDLSAPATTEMRMTGPLAAVIRKLKMPPPLPNIRLMHRALLKKPLKRAVNRYLVWRIFTQPFGNIVLTDRPARLKQRRRNRHPRRCLSKTAQCKPCLCLRRRLFLHLASFLPHRTHLCPMCAPSPLTNSIGKTISLTQHGSHTAINSAINIPASITIL